MSRDSDQHSLSVVQAAAKVALYSSFAKQRLANQLLLRARDTNHSAYKAQISLENAAQAAWLSPKELLNQLRGDPCFKVVKGAATAGGSAHIFVSLDVPHIISTARSSTRTGYLVEELPTPKGYVLGVHPLRPGRHQHLLEAFLVYSTRTSTHCWSKAESSGVPEASIYGWPCCQPCLLTLKLPGTEAQ
jgi:hypothetical protein